MAAPITRGTLVVFPQGPGETTDNLTSLGDGEAKGLGAIDSGAKADEIIAPIRVKSDAAAWAAGDKVSIYLVHSEDDIVWTDNIDPDATADQAAKILAAHHVQTLPLEANDTELWFREFSLFSELGFMPKWWGVVVFNQGVATGADLSATAGDHFAKHAPMNWV